MARALGQLSRAADDDRDELTRLREQVLSQQVENEHLHQGLLSARTIGTALGIIMERDKLTPEQAFATLSQLSQRSNIKARDVAERIVLTGEY